MIKINKFSHNKLKTYRKTVGMTLEEVANEIGVSKTTVQRYETGAIPNIPLKSIKAMSKLYGITTDALLEVEFDESMDNAIIQLLTAIGFDCFPILNEFSLSNSQSNNNSVALWKIRTPSGDNYDLSHDDLIELRSGLQDCISFQLFKLRQKK